MKKVLASSALMVLFFGVGTIGNSLAGEKYKLRTVKSSVKWEQIAVGDQEGHALVLEEAKGVSSNMEDKWFGEGWVQRHVGFIDMNTTTGMTSGHGYEEVTDQDGNKYFFFSKGNSSQPRNSKSTLPQTGSLSCRKNFLYISPCFTIFYSRSYPPTYITSSFNSITAS